MITSPDGIDFIKSFEGFKGKSYPDPKTGGAPYTIGYGTTVYPNGTKVRLGETISESTALAFLTTNLTAFENAVNTLVTVSLNQNQFDALVSFTYNLGRANFASSTLLKLLNAGDYDGASKQFIRWVSPGSSVEKGLTIRRKAEAELFNS